MPVITSMVLKLRGQNGFCDILKRGIAVLLQSIENMLNKKATHPVRSLLRNIALGHELSGKTADMQS